MLRDAKIANQSGKLTNRATGTTTKLGAVIVAATIGASRNEEFSINTLLYQIGERMIDAVLFEMRRCLLLGAKISLCPKEIALILDHIDDIKNEEEDEDFWRNELGIGDC